MTYYDLHPPADVPGGPWLYNSLTKLVAHPQLLVSRRAVELARTKAGDYPVRVKGWTIVRRDLNPTTILL